MSASKLSKDGHRHQEVAAHVPHKALHLAFVVALPGAAEPVLEQVVGLQLGECSRALAAAIAQDPGNSQPGIVVEDALRHSAQVGEGGNVPVKEGLGGLRRVGLHEAAVAVGQVDDEAVGLLLHAADDRQGLAKVALGVSRRMGQRHEHLPCLTAILSDVVLDRGVSTVESVFVPEPLEDALGSVALLPGTPEVVLQDPVNDACEGIQLGLLWRNLPAITRRDRVGQHFAHGVPVQAESPGGIPYAHPLHHHRPANPEIYVHLVHPSHHPWVGYNPMDDGRRYSIQSPILSNLPPTRPTLSPPFTGRRSAR